VTSSVSMIACGPLSRWPRASRSRCRALSGKKRSTSWRKPRPGTAIERGRPMPDFLPHTFDAVVCRQQVQELKSLLDSSADIGEAAFHEFFEPRLHLRALIGRLNPALA